jgi:HAD superfamily hydrolase (TIGR01484 family)
MTPLARCPRPVLAALRGVLTDFDGTLTTRGRLEPATYQALSDLRAAGLFVAVVTGRPAGWGELVARTFPVDACVVENGGLAMFLEEGRLVRRYYRPDAAGRARDRRRLSRLVREVMAVVPGARLSGDSRYTEVDLAIDWNEEARLAPAKARRLERLCRERGASAVRSSVHVNVWLGGFDKRTACEDLLRERAGGHDLARFAYVGDAPNDAPMFAAFPASFGVADVRASAAEMDALPRWVARARGGAGFREIATAILEAR